MEEDFLSEKKTLEGLCEYITNQARKKATENHHSSNNFSSNYYLCTDINEFYEWAEDYIRAEEPESWAKPKANAPKLKLKENDDGQLSFF